MTILSDNIRRLRRAEKLNQREFGKLFEVSPAAVSLWEKDTLPDMPKMIALANHFNTPIDELLNNPKCLPGEHTKLDAALLTKVFKTLEKNLSLHYAFHEALKKGLSEHCSHLILLLYSIGYGKNMTATQLGRLAEKARIEHLKNEKKQPTNTARRTRPSTR